jgi:uncharacterized membrane protein
MTPTISLIVALALVGLVAFIAAKMFVKNLKRIAVIALAVAALFVAYKYGVVDNVDKTINQVADKGSALIKGGF